MDTTSTQATVLNTYYAKKNLMQIFANTNIYPFLEEDTMPWHNTKVWTARRWGVLDEFEQLAEGENPVADTMSQETVTATQTVHGKIVKVTDELNWSIEDPILNIYVDRVKESAIRSIDKLSRDVLLSATTAYACNTGATADVLTYSLTTVNSFITKDAQQYVVQQMLNNYAQKYYMPVNPSPNYGTTGISSAFVCLAPKQAKTKLVNLTGFVEVKDYARGTLDSIHKDELGTLDDVRYVLCDSIETVGNGVNSTAVYPFIYLGKMAATRVKLDGKGLYEMSIIPIGQKDKTDILGRWGAVGASFYFAGAVTKDEWMSIIYAEV